MTNKRRADQRVEKRLAVVAEKLPSERRLISLSEAQELTGIPRRTWYRYVEQGVVESVRVERAGIYIDPSNILR